MEHDTLQATFAIGALAAVVAAVLAVVILTRWLRRQRAAQAPTLATCLVFITAVAVAGFSAAWLVHERAEKCGPTVARTLCRTPTEWLQLP